VTEWAPPTSRYVLKIEGLAGRIEDPEAASRYVGGVYLAEYDPDAYGGRGAARWTEKIEEALTFPDVTAALECWKQTSTLQPVREDGKPNRPLTAFTVTAEPV